MSKLESALAPSDFVPLAIPLDSTTQSIIGESQLARVKPSGVIINVARGTLIEEEAPHRACRDRTIGGAIIDTWYRYPRPEISRGEPSVCPFRDLDNVIMTPHASAWSEGLLPRRNTIIARNLDLLAFGKPLLNLVRAPAARVPEQERRS
jgi:phosphoglycerate dehydrogenase-like enzyme